MAKYRIVLFVLFIFVSLAGCADGPSCGSMTGGAGTPSIAFTSVPALGSTASLSGQVLHVVPANYYVAVYIFVPGEGYWVKPTFASPETALNCDGTFSADVTTGGLDTEATVITAFVLPDTYSPSLLGGSATLPTWLYAAAIATASVTR